MHLAKIVLLRMILTVFMRLIYLHQLLMDLFHSHGYSNVYYHHLILFLYIHLFDHIDDNHWKGQSKFIQIEGDVGAIKVHNRNRDDENMMFICKKDDEIYELLYNKFFIKNVWCICYLNILRVVG